jgi:hypothetical protein
VSLTTIKETVAGRIASLSTVVESSVVDVLAEQVKDKRVKTILAGLDLLDAARNDLKKIKPDQQSFGADNKPVSETYSKTAMESKKKLEEKIVKIETALNLALDPATQDYKKLFEVVNNKGNAPAADSKQAPAEE